MFSPSVRRPVSDSVSIDRYRTCVVIGFSRTRVPSLNRNFGPPHLLTTVARNQMAGLRGPVGWYYTNEYDTRVHDGSTCVLYRPHARPMENDKQITK